MLSSPIRFIQLLGYAIRHAWVACPNAVDHVISNLMDAIIDKDWHGPCEAECIAEEVADWLILEFTQVQSEHDRAAQEWIDDWHNHNHVNNSDDDTYTDGSFAPDGEDFESDTE
jgi:carbamate kinase